MEHSEIIERAIKAAGGRPGKLAAKIGVTRQAIEAWRKVPVDRLEAVEAATGIPREELRPDIFIRR
jgi:DNA-binding transcriptional regulator YdaS (Cro superfamily)